jgi:hypothetical protein
MTKKFFSIECSGTWGINKSAPHKHSIFGWMSVRRNLNSPILKTQCEESFKLGARKLILDWCCFYYFIRNGLVALLEVLRARWSIVERNPKISSNEKWLWDVLDLNIFEYFQNLEEAAIESTKCSAPKESVYNWLQLGIDGWSVDSKSWVAHPPPPWFLWKLARKMAEMDFSDG